MSKVIIHPQGEEGRIVVMYVNVNCELSLEAIAKKDVPYGLPYKFVESADLPDYTFFDAFEADFSEPDGYGAAFGIGTDLVVVSWDGDIPTVCKTKIDERGVECLDLTTAFVFTE